ncbi:hypothetical protein BS47DRAFT_1346461 [Hydnum rufescens UP504]|uniref:Nucleoporin NDC1 n=1 Tax=Hydnum rufescens UP504 TaxID=1448309 RepID=A0A9P6DUJ6_9AGAM|nr:hypothetical protein BS47DRAFT_1346461 [Hydnum rufescens UP504]
MSTSAPIQSGYTPASIYSVRPKQPTTNASNSYEHICKFVLRRRMLRVLVLSAFTTWMCTTIWSFSPRNGLFHEIIASISPSQIILLLPTYALGLLPSFILLRLYLRNEYENPETQTFPTVFSRISSLLSPTLFRHLLAYGIQGWVLAFSYCISAGLREWDDPRLSIFSPTLRHHLNFNERFVFITISNVVLGIVYAFKSLATMRPTACWPDSTTRPPHRPNFLPKLWASIIPAALLSISISISYIVTYYFVRLRLWKTLLYFAFFLRPYMSTFVRAKYSPITFGLIFRTLTVNLLTSLTWETMRVLFEVYTSEPIVLSRHAPDPNQCLVLGIVSTDRYIKHHAFHEFAVLAQTTSPEASARRKALFSDLKTPHPQSMPTLSPGSIAGAWSTVSREALLVLGINYQNLLRRGAPPPPPPAVASSALAPIAVPSPSSAHTLSIVKPPAGIFRPPRTSTSSAIMDTFSSEGATTNVLSNIADSAQRGASAIPRIFLGESLSSAPSTGPLRTVGIEQGSNVTSVVRTLPSMLRSAVKSLPSLASLQGLAEENVKKHVVRRLPPALRFRVYDARWLLFGSKVEMVEGTLRGRKIDVWAIESLAYLVAHSLTEDPYGVVQRDLPRVLEALVSYLVALEALAQELEKQTSSIQAAPSSTEEMKRYMMLRKQRESELIGELIGPLLTCGVARRDKTHRRCVWDTTGGTQVPAVDCRAASDYS